MNKEFAAKWVAALREEDRRQVRGVLKRLVDPETGEALGHDQVTPESKTFGYCCLGVACEILAEDGEITATPWGAEFLFGRVTEDGDILEYGSSFTLPKLANGPMGVDLDFMELGYIHDSDMCDWWDNHPSTAELQRPMAYSLANFNDMGVPFRVIADFIEKFADRL